MIMPYAGIRFARAGNAWDGYPLIVEDEYCCSVCVGSVESVGKEKGSSLKTHDSRKNSLLISLL